MDLQSYLRVIRKRWRTIAVTVLVVLVAAAVATALSPRKYESTVQFFVSTSDSSSGAELVQGGTFTQQRVKSYSELITTPKVLAPVAKDAGVKDATTLSGKVTAEAPPETVLIEATVLDSSPEQAMKVAKALGKQFPKTIDEIEQVSEKRGSPVKVTTVREPSLNSTPVSPHVFRNMAIALVLGLLLGLSLALLRDRLDTRVRSKNDVAETTTAPVIGTIPFDSDAPNHPLCLTTDTHSNRSEAFRSLRTNLQFVDADKHPRVIVLTSTLPNEGKSTTAANLALALADSDASVCLIEGDMRRPRLMSYLGLEGAVGLTDVLVGSIGAHDVLQQFGRHELWVIGAGTRPPNPSELLGSQAMRDFIERLRNRFDYVIIDAPPLLPVTDGAVLGALADGAIMVTGSGLVSREQVRSAIGSLEQVNASLLGVVLNRAPQSKRGGYEYRYYDYQAETEATDHKRRPRASWSRRERKKLEKSQESAQA